MRCMHQPGQPRLLKLYVLVVHKKGPRASITEPLGARAIGGSKKSLGILQILCFFAIQFDLLDHRRCTAFCGVLVRYLGKEFTFHFGLKYKYRFIIKLI